MKQIVGILGATVAGMLMVASASAADAPEGEWRMAGKDYANRRFSALDQITTSNVSNLKVAWTFSTGVDRGQECAPLIVSNTMYVVSPYPNHLFALDVGNSGALKWQYDPKPDAASQGVACCDVVNRGAVYSDGKIIFNTLDAHTVAVDANSGKELWNTQLGDINKAETMTMAPLVVKGKVLVGNSGAEYGVRGWLTALDVNSGKIAWRAYTTGPDSDVLIGSKFNPHYEQFRGKDLGVKSWPPEHWKIGGGTVWGFLSYDPELNLVYEGTANPGCWNPELRPGDNLWSCGIFARNPEDGQAVWYYQWNPHDLFDHDGINENVLVDLTIDGKQRKTLLHPDRNGLLYVVDRVSGEVISATPFVRVTSNNGVDLKTGKLRYVDSKKPVTGKVVRDVAPASPGGKDWQPCAFSPRTGWLYIPHQNFSMDYEGTEANYIAGTPYVGVNEKIYAGPEGNRGELCAWDPVAAKKTWIVKEDLPVWSGVVATAGDIVFYGTMEGWFKAVNARTGQALWKFKTGSGIIGQPVTYLGADGKQYVAILSGIGGWAGTLVSQAIDVRDATAATGFATALPDLKQKTTKGGTLYVFSL